MIKEIKWLEGQVAILRKANEYLHSLRCIFMIEGIYEWAISDNFDTFAISVVKQKLSKGKYHCFYEATGIKGDVFYRKKADNLEDLEKLVKGEKIIKDEDLL